MKEELQQLLDSWDYDASLAWFKKHVEGKFFLKTMLSKGADAYNVQKLKAELFEVLHSLPEEILPTAVGAKAPTPDRSKPSVVHQAAETIEELQLNQEWKPLYKEASFYHAELSPNNSEEENRKLAFKILETMDEVEKIWKDRDFVRQYGVKPEFGFQGLESLSPAKLLNRRNTLRTYISKANKGKLSTEKIPQWEAELAEVEKLLKS
jgi:hypothetical protein